VQADHDSTANAISITIAAADRADRSDEVHPRAIVALLDEQPIEVQRSCTRTAASPSRSRRLPTAMAWIMRHWLQPRSPRLRPQIA
jgi:hypothetical protein